MTDRGSRDRLALALRRYVSGRITNDDLDAVDVDHRDPGVAAVQHAAWFLYDDLREHRVEGSIPRGSELRRDVARWILFLRSDEEYFWPDRPGSGILDLFSWPLNVLTLGGWARRRKRACEAFLAAGDPGAWPFISQEQLERARRRHPWRPRGISDAEG